MRVRACSCALWALLALLALLACASTTVNASGSGVDLQLDAAMDAAEADLFREIDLAAEADADADADEDAALLELDMDSEEGEGMDGALIESYAEEAAMGTPKKAPAAKKNKAPAKAPKAAKAAKSKAPAKAKANAKAPAKAKAKAPAKSKAKAKAPAKSKAKATNAKAPAKAKTAKAKTPAKAKTAKSTAKQTKAKKTTTKKAKTTAAASKTSKAGAKKAKTAKKKTTKAVKATKTKAAKTTKAAKAPASASTPARNGSGRTGGAKFGATFGVTPFSAMSSAQFKKKFLNSWNHLTAGQKLRPRSRNTGKKATTSAASKAAAKTKVKKLAMRLMQMAQPAKKTTKPAGQTSSTGTAQKQLNGQNGPGRAVGTALTQSAVARLRAESANLPAPKHPKPYGLVDQDVDFSDWSPFVRTHSTCGACWAQVAADVVQAGLVRARGKKAYTVGAQFWMDCDVAGGNFRANLACDGGSVMNALQYSIKTGHAMMDPLKGGDGRWAAGIVYAESDYPWQYNKEGQHACADRPGHSKRKAVLRDWSYAVKPTHSLILDSSEANAANLMGDAYQAPGNPNLALGGKQGAIRSGNREALLAMALNNFGPLAVIIDAAGLQGYTGGVATPKQLGCSSDPSKGTHAMLLVGMQTASNGAKYWVLKNSWGRDWGEDGYLYLARGGDPCGITAAAVYANIDGDKKDPIATVAERTAQVASDSSWVPESARQASAAVQQRAETSTRSAADAAAIALSRGECDPNEMTMREPTPELFAKCRQNEIDMRRIAATKSEPMPQVVITAADRQKMERLAKERDDKLREIRDMRNAINQPAAKAKATKPKKA